MQWLLTTLLWGCSCNNENWPKRTYCNRCNLPRGGAAELGGTQITGMEAVTEATSMGQELGPSWNGFQPVASNAPAQGSATPASQHTYAHQANQAAVAYDSKAVHAQQMQYFQYYGGYYTADHQWVQGAPPTLPAVGAAQYAPPAVQYAAVAPQYAPHTNYAAVGGMAASTPGGLFLAKADAARALTCHWSC